MEVMLVSICSSRWVIFNALSVFDPSVTFKVTVTFKNQNAPEFRASCAKMDEPIELKLCTGTRMEPDNIGWAWDLEIFNHLTCNSACNVM